MVAASWPAYARLRATGYELSAGTTTTRTEFDDGAVRQARTVTRPVTRRTVAAEIPGARLPDFRAWAETYAARYFLVTDLVDGQPRGMRVVGGVGGITYRQISSRPGPARWEASLVLEDAGGVAGGAPWFGRTSIHHVFTNLHPLILPAAYGGTAPVRTRLLPSLPAVLRFDAATRTLSRPGGEGLLDETPFRWIATDADDRRATVYLHLAAANVLSRRFTRPAAGTIRMELIPNQHYLPASWFPLGLPVSRYFASFKLTRAGVAGFSIGPDATSSDLAVDTAARLRFHLAAVIDSKGNTIDLDIPGPASASATTRDVTEPYSWETGNAAGASDFIDAIPDTAYLSVWYWRAA